MSRSTNRDQRRAAKAALIARISDLMQEVAGAHLVTDPADAPHRHLLDRVPLIVQCHQQAAHTPDAVRAFYAARSLAELQACARELEALLPTREES